MLPMKRLNDIKEILITDKQADVSTLAHKLKVTEATIRRDLEKLEEEQFLTRTHGGAILNEQVPTIASAFVQNDLHPEVYQNIGKIAAQFVENDSLIFLGPGICTRYIARELSSKKNVNVVTNDLYVAHDCAVYSPNVSVIVVSGILNPTTMQLYGQMTFAILESFYFSSAFFEIDGITLRRGYSVDSPDKAFLTQNISKNICKKSYAVSPYQNFDTESAAIVGNMDAFSAVITNERVPGNYKEFYFNNNIPIYATINVY